MRTASAALFLGLVAVGCSKTPDVPSKYPARQPGCEIQTFPEAPSYQTENIGTVTASCDETISDADCMRTLKDQACKLGADTIWGVDDKPVMDLGKKKMSGRAAHQK